MIWNGILGASLPQEMINYQHWISCEPQFAIKPNRVPNNCHKRRTNSSSIGARWIKNAIQLGNMENHLEEGKRRCVKNFGTFPVLRISLYGKFLTTTNFHKPTNPPSSGVLPSVESVERVSSSTNITKHTFFFEYSLIWKGNDQFKLSTYCYIYACFGLSKDNNI